MNLSDAGPWSTTLVDTAYAATLRKIELIATHRDGKVWIVQKP
jgi:hypothetical protein